MKHLKSIFLAVMIIILPFPALAWPRILHDDGGPYRDLAVASAGSQVAAAVLTPTTIELTVLNSDGDRQAWSSFELPQDIWQLPKQKISLQLFADHQRGYELAVPLIAGDEGGIIYAGIFSARLIVQGDQVTIMPTNQPRIIGVPVGSQDMEVFFSPSNFYVIWTVVSEDNIATVLVNGFDRFISTSASIR